MILLILEQIFLCIIEYINKVEALKPLICPLYSLNILEQVENSVNVQIVQ